MYSRCLHQIACTGLESLFQRRPSELEHVVPTILEGFGIAPDIAAAISISHSASSDYTFHKALARVLASLSDVFLHGFQLLKDMPPTLPLYVLMPRAHMTCQCMRYSGTDAVAEQQLLRAACRDVGPS
jgi:hypothetical protein